jgi:Xaa-Pro aminopeptidase
MGTSCCIFTKDGEVHLLLPEDEVELAAQTSGAQRTSFQPASLDQITDASKAIRDPLVRVVRQLGLDQASIGIEASQFLQPSSYAVMNLYLSGIHELLRGAFPKLQLIPADNAFEQLKTTKTPCEMSKIRLAARIAGTAFETQQDAIGSGMRETEIASRFQCSFECAPAATNTQRSYGFFFCMSGPNAAKADAAYARTRQRVVNNGDLVMMHCNSCCDGFWTDITRTYTAGDGDSRQEEMRSAIMAAREAALAAIAPGVEAKEVDRAARMVLQQRGFGPQFKHATGHGIGFAAANHNGIPRIHPKSPDVLASGMTFNVEPAIYFEGYGGMRHCDMVGVTENGVEVLTDF